MFEFKVAPRHRRAFLRRSRPNLLPSNFRATLRNMTAVIVGVIIAAMILSDGAKAQTCPSYPYTFANGTTADATQVNSNFSGILNCANTLLAPIASPNFTGIVNIGSPTSTATLNLGNSNSTSGASFRLLNDLSANLTSAIYGSTATGATVLGQARAGLSFLLTGSANTAPLAIGTSSAQPLILGTNNTEYMRLSSTGNVGIGDTASAYKLEVSGALSVTTGSHFISSFDVGSTVSGQPDVLLGYQANGSSVTSNLIYSANALPLSFGTSSASQALTLLNNGNVGIGTTTPAQLLSVAGNAYLTGGLGVGLTDTAAGTISASSSMMAPSFYTDSANDGMNSVPGANTIGFRTNGIDNRLVINSSGNVGIGTTTPSALLTVAGNASIGGDLNTTGTLSANALTLTTAMTVPNGGTGAATFTGLLKGNGTAPIGTATAGTDYLAPTSLSATAPLAYAADTFSLNTDATLGVVGGNLGLNLANPNTFTALQQFNGGASASQFTTTGSADLATAGGNVGIGTATPAQALEVNGQVQIDSFASAASDGVCELAGVLSSCSSSIRYKENVKDATFGLNEVEQMRPVTFKWKGRDQNDLGLIAEEVAKINPLFATYKDGKVEGVKYAQLTAVLVNAIKELKTSNDTQAARLAKQEAEIAQLQRQVSALVNDPMHRAADTTSRVRRLASAAGQR